MKLAKGFREFLSADSRTPKLIGLILIGLVLILIGSFFGRSDTVTKSEGGADERVAEMCSMMDGVGECQVMITYTQGGDEVYAVLVLCDGADSPSVRERITSTITSLYGIGAHRVEIHRLNKN